jgi:8-oxo-dGTP pyrophosphatase MutT (NUDIX family)
MTGSPRLKVMVIPFRRDPLRVLLLKRSVGTAVGRWLPVTGHVEPGEFVPDAAVREALEETGLTGRLRDLGLSHRFTVAEGPLAGAYEEHAFALEADSEEARLDFEHSEAAWLAPDEATLRLPFETQREAVRRVALLAAAR